MDEHEKIASDAKALQRELDGLRLKLAGYPSWMRPAVRWVLEKTRSVAMWIEREAKDYRNG